MDKKYMKKIIAFTLTIVFVFVGINVIAAVESVEVIDISADDMTISWAYSGGEYKGANIYKLEKDNTLNFKGTTEELKYECNEMGNYIVRAVTDSGESRGKIITLTDGEIFTVALEDCIFKSDSVSCKVRIKNNDTNMNNGVLTVRTVTLNGETDNLICSKITLLSGSEKIIGFSIPIIDFAFGLEVFMSNSYKPENVISNSVVQYVEGEKPELIADELSVKASKLLKLINKCEEQGISVDYEKINYSVINRFADYVKEDIENNDLSRLDYTYESCSKLYSSAKANMEAYLAGKKVSQSVPKYITSDVDISKQSMLAYTNINGETVKRPVFFVGYGHFDKAREDIPVFNDFGANAIQQEIGPSLTINKPWICETSNDPVCSAERCEDVFIDGEQSLKITYSSDVEANHYISLRQTINVEPGKTYYLTGKTKADKAGLAWISANNYADRHYIGAADSNTQTEYDWKNFEIKYTVPENVTSTVVRILVEGRTDAMYFDGLSFKEEGTSNELLKGGDFENYGTYLDYEFNPDSEAVKNIKEMLADADEHNIAVSLLISPHYFINEIIEEAGIEYSDNAFLKYNVNAPVARYIIEKYIRGLIPIVKDYNSLNNICLANEPFFNTNNLPEFYTPIWNEWLEEKYGDIGKLNDIWNSSYNSFDEINLPMNNSDKAKYYDYKLFNDEMLGSWHKFMADIIKELAPDIPIHTKVIGYTNSRGIVNADGRGYEEYYEYLDLNGCDFWNCIDDNRQPLVKEMWNDYMLSFKNVPIANTEDHVITDKSSNVYTPDVADYVAQDIYQGAVHGRAVSNIWVWERSTNKESSMRDSILYRPDVIAKVGYAANDLNRLAHEITALQNESAEVGIVYSNANMMYNSSGMNAAYEAYEAVVFNGQKARFILDNNPEMMHDYKLVIVPYVMYMTDETAAELEKYIDNGGQVIVMGENNFKYDQYGIESLADRLRLKDKLSSMSNCTEVDYEGNGYSMINPQKEALCEIVRNVLENANAYYVKVIDTKTNKPVNCVEYNLGAYNGKTIINLSNFGEEKTVKLFIDGTQIKEATELRSNNVVKELFTIGKYEVITLEVNSTYR